MNLRRAISLVAGAYLKAGVFVFTLSFTLTVGFALLERLQRSEFP